MQIAVLGGGSWGTAISLLLTDKGHNVRLWSNEPEVVLEINTKAENSKYIPGIRFSGGVHATESMSNAIGDIQTIIMAVPSNAVREVAEKLAKIVVGRPLLVNIGKGLESKTGLRISEVLSEVIGDAAYGSVALSGPNLAVEVARKTPTATVVASADNDRAFTAQELFSSPHLRVYRSRDVAGVELGGALKNVLAVGAGICDGLGFGDNTKAAFLTRGLAEMTRLGVALGAQPQTFHGLAGIGDLMATCSSRLSRNLRVGLAIGKGATLEQALAEVKQVAEGVPTCEAAYSLSQSTGVEAPIIEQIHKILYKGKSPRQAVTDLMLREPKAE